MVCFFVLFCFFVVVFLILETVPEYVFAKTKNTFVYFYFVLFRFCKNISKYYLAVMLHLLCLNSKCFFCNLFVFASILVQNIYDFHQKNINNFMYKSSCYKMKIYLFVIL